MEKQKAIDCVMREMITGPAREYALQAIRAYDGKCTSAVTIRPDGVNDLDPCLYEEIETHRGVTVHVYRCRRCGHTEIMWEDE